MNRKGAELPENVISIIVAIIVILVFVFAAYKLFTVYRNQELDNAKNTIDVIKGKIDALELGQTGTFLIQGFEQKKNTWLVVGWGKGDTNAPDKCNYKSCLCVCPLSMDSNTGSLTASCQSSNGFCRTINIEKLNVQANYALGKKDPFIDLPENVKEISITKSGDSISILSDAEPDRIVLPGKVSEQGVQAGG